MQPDLIAGTKFPAPLGVGAGLELSTPLCSTRKLQGGIIYVDTIAERDAIPAIFREWRMIVGVEETGLDYKLILGKSSANLSDNGNWRLLLEVPDMQSGDVGKLLRAGSGNILEWGPRFGNWNNVSMLGTLNVDYTVSSTPRYKVIDSLVLLDVLINFPIVSGYSHTAFGQGFQFGSINTTDAGTGGVRDVLMTKRVVDSGNAIVLGSYVRVIISSSGNLSISTVNDVEIDSSGNSPTKTDPKRALTSVFTTSDSYTKHDGSTVAYPFNFNGCDSEQLGGFTLDLRGITIARG